MLFKFHLGGVRQVAYTFLVALSKSNGGLMDIMGGQRLELDTEDWALEEEMYDRI